MNHLIKYDRVWEMVHTLYKPYKLKQQILKSKVPNTHFSEEEKQKKKPKQTFRVFFWYYLVTTC